MRPNLVSQPAEGVVTEGQPSHKGGQDDGVCLRSVSEKDGQILGPHHFIDQARHAGREEAEEDNRPRGPCGHERTHHSTEL